MNWAWLEMLFRWLNWYVNVQLSVCLELASEVRWFCYFQQQMDLKHHEACRRVRCLCRNHVDQRWAVACLSRRRDSLVRPSSCSATFAVASSPTRRCRYTSRSVSRNGMCRTTSCQGQRDDLGLRNRKFLSTPVTWQGRLRFLWAVV